MANKLERVVKQSAYAVYSKAALIEPAASGFVFMAAEIDRRPPFLPASRAKRALIAACKQTCATLMRRSDVAGAVSFKAMLIPPGKGAFLKARSRVHVARYDLAVLIETDSVASARRLRTDATWLALEQRMRTASPHTCVVSARNVRRIGAVDHERQGVYLFNYFFADDRDQNLAVWDYTAGWFERETGLDNSTVLVPLEGEDFEYTLLNHCRWDRWRDVLPSLFLKRSFRDYVEANFEANHVAPIPVLYRKA